MRLSYLHLALEVHWAEIPKTSEAQAIFAQSPCVEIIKPSSYGVRYQIMTIRISAFNWVPAFARGYVKDLRVRWALEELGLPYEVVLINHDTKASQGYRSWQPFGQVPAYEEDGQRIFESGAIVLHVAEKSDVLSPVEPFGRARVRSWVFAALNSIEPAARAFIDAQGGDGAATDKRRVAGQAELLDGRLAALSVALGQNDYLEGRFSAGDLIMTTVLRELVDSGVLSAHPTLAAHRERCEGRSAFARAMAGQLRDLGTEGAPEPVRTAAAS